MLLPNNIHPEYTIYYNASLIIQMLKSTEHMHFIDLYEIMKTENNISFTSFTLCLDWLYLIDVAIINKRGVVKLCL